MNILSSIARFILDFIKALALFVIITIGVFILIVGIISGWLYYKYAQNIKNYDTCVYKSKHLDVEKYIESQKFVVKPGVNAVTLNLKYSLVLDPIIAQMQNLEMPSFLTKPLNIIGRAHSIILGKLLGIDKTRPVACVKVLSPDELEIFAGTSWYLWGSTVITKKLLPTRLELSGFKFYTFRIPEDYLDYIFSGDVNTTIQLSGQTVSPADIEFTKDVIQVKYKVSDLLIK